MEAATAVKQGNIAPAVTEFLGRRLKMLIDGQWVDSASGKTFTTVDPSTEEVLAQVAGRQRRGRRPGGARGAPRLRERRLADDDRLRARPGACGSWPTCIEAARRGVRAAREPRQRQAAHRRARRRRAARRSTTSATTPAGRPRSRARRSRSSVPAALPRLHAARAGRRGRADHPVELPAADGGVEARARRWRAATRWCSSRRSRRRCRRCGSASCSAMPASRRAWSTSSPASARRPGAALAAHPGVDKVAFTGCTEVGTSIVQRRGRQPEAGIARARRQVAEHRLRRRRPGSGGRGRGGGDLLQPRAVLLRRLAALRRAEGVRRGDAERVVEYSREDHSSDRASTRRRRWVRWSRSEQFDRVSGYLAAGKKEGAKVADGRRRPARARQGLLRRADGVHRRAAAT